MTRHDPYPGYRPRKSEDADDLIVRHKHGTLVDLCHYCHLPLIAGECWVCDAPITENVEETVQLDGGGYPGGEDQREMDEQELGDG